MGHRVLKFEKERGFSLVELLVGIVIIGVLATIAIPLFAEYREQAYVASIHSSLKNIAAAQEAYFIDRQIYFSDILGVNMSALPGYVQTPGIVASTSAGGAGNAGLFQACAYHELGPELTYAIDTKGRSGEGVGIFLCASSGKILIGDCW